MSIADWPAGERPREKLLARGPGVLSDAELIAIFVRTGTRGKTAVDISRELLQVYGGIRGVLTADQQEPPAVRRVLAGSGTPPCRPRWSLGGVTWLNECVKSMLSPHRRPRAPT